MYGPFVGMHMYIYVPEESRNMKHPGTELSGMGAGSQT